jgi:MtN3 and saliva related transmembrane protein
MRFQWTIVIGFLAAAFTTVSYVPQVMKALKTKETKDISLLMLLMLSAGLFMWFVYGLLLSDLPIIIANCITFVLAFLVLLLKIRYG